MPHFPHDEGLPVHEGPSAALLPPVEDANTDSFLESLDEPQCGHFVPRESRERIRISLSWSHFSQ